MMYQQYPAGWVEVICGCMFAGKTEELIRRIKTLQYGKKKVKVFKPRIDNRYAIDEIASHSGYKVSCICIDEANDILNHLEDDDEVICVDEVQFLKSHQIDQLFEIAVGLDIPVICYGLRTDFKMQGFEGSIRLLLLAHSIEEMKTICKCGRKAVLNGRKINGNFVFEGKQVAIDHIDNVEYEALCGHCYFKYKSQE